MTRKILHSILLLLLLLAGLSACTDTLLVQDSERTLLPNGDVLLKSEVSVQGIPQVVTRDIDPDGLVITNIWMLCFDDKYCYIGRREATFTTVTNESGTSYKLSVGVPQATKVIHIVGNLSLGDFNAPVGISENTLLPSLLSASGRMAYWARHEFTDGPANFSGIKLLCNQAKVSYEVDSNATDVTVQGFALCYCRAWGTIAPFNPSAEGNKFDFPLDKFNELYITSPDGEHLGLSPDPEEVSAAAEQYLFEDPNTLEEPVYAIMKIKTASDNGKYYKIMFVDAENNQLPLYRNYEYKINILSVPTALGYTSFDEAKNGTAANNVWVSIDPEIPSLSDGTNTLDIPGGTTYVYTASGAQSIPFTYDGDGTVSVSWLKNDGSVSLKAPVVNPVTPATESTASTTQSYAIDIELLKPKDLPSTGTLVLRAGEFTRQIKVYLMKEMEFKPVLASTPIPQVKGELVAMTFMIPDTYPAEMFPITCKIATNKMNPVNTDGKHFTTIAEDCSFWITHTAEDGTETTDEHKTDWGYKFVYTIDKPGPQEVLFRMNSSVGNDTEGTVSGCKEEQGVLHTHIFLEADYFKDEEKIIHFQEAEENNRIRFVGEGADNTEPEQLVVPGQLVMTNVLPTANQEVTCSLYFEGTNVPAGSQMRISTEALKDLSIGTEGVSIVKTVQNDVSTDYWLEFNSDFIAATDNVLTLNFKTKSAKVDDYVRFFMDNKEDGTANTTKFKSATLSLKSAQAFDFGLTMNPEIPYGIGQPLVLTFTVPGNAIETTGLKVNFLTKNLGVDPSDPYFDYLHAFPGGGGYELDIPGGSDKVEAVGSIRFLTTRIASAETVTLCTADDTQALFDPIVKEYANTPATGTISLPEGLETPLDANSFIALERKNGTRVGVFKITSSGTTATYELTLRPEYEFTMDEPLTVHYHNLVSSKILQATTTFNDLMEKDCHLSLIVVSE